MTKSCEFFGKCLQRGGSSRNLGDRESTTLLSLVAVKMTLPAPSAADRLSQIQTQWSAILEMDSGDESQTRLGELLIRYAGAVYRYLLVVARDEDVASDLTQEFAFRFMRGDFRSADPSRGRFRDFLKRSIVNLAMDHFRRSKRQPTLDAAFADQDRSLEVDWDRAFDESWRREILDRTWSRLEPSSEQWTVLRLRAESPETSSTELAQLVSERLGRAVRSDWTRQTLSRARTRFAELLRIEVAESLEGADDATIDDELSRLGLLKYVTR